MKLSKIVSFSMIFFWLNPKAYKTRLVKKKFIFQIKIIVLQYTFDTCYQHYRQCRHHSKKLFYVMLLIKP